MPTIYTGYRNYTRFYLSWNVARQDIANNRSLINWTAGIQGQPGWWPSWYSNAIRLNSVYIDGHGNLASGTWSNITLNNGQTIPLRSGSVWIGHNSNGTKSFGASVSGWFYGNGDVSTSGSWSIATIPRNSQVTTNKSSYTLGEPVVIYTNRKSGSFTHRITIRKDNSGGTVLRTFDNVTNSVTWTPTAAEITSMQNMIPNTNTFRIYIHQHNHQVGQASSATRNLALTDANPIFENFTYRDSNIAVTTITGDDQVLVKGQSTLETKITPTNKMTAIKGASENRYSITFEGMTAQEDYSDTVDVISEFPQVSTIGQRTIVATAFDSRNNNTSVAKQVTVYDYAAPTIESRLKRENNFGEDTTVHLEGNWTPLIINGGAKNSILSGTLKYRYGVDGEAFGPWTTRPFTTNGEKWKIGTDFVVSLDNTKKYVFEFQISDRFQTVFSTASVDVGRPIMFVGEMDGAPAIGVGKMPSQPGVDIVGPVYSNGNRVPFGGWDEIARYQGAVTTTTKTLEFEPYRYIKIVVRSSQSSTGTSQGTIRITLGPGTNYNRAVHRVTSSGTSAHSVGTASDIIMAVSTSSGYRSYAEAEVYVGGNYGGDLAIWRMVTQDNSWLSCTGQYFFFAGTAQLSPLYFRSTTQTYDAEIIVYGHN